MPRVEAGGREGHYIRCAQHGFKFNMPLSAYLPGTIYLSFTFEILAIVLITEY